MKYMLLICHEDSLEPSETLVEEIMAWVKETERQGIRKGGAHLRPASDATTVRVQSGEVVLSDGPFAEAKEQVAGFAVIESQNLDEVLEVASRHPILQFGGSVEVRPVWES
jgi:hypothetical protein